MQDLLHIVVSRLPLPWKRKVVCKQKHLDHCGVQSLDTKTKLVPEMTQLFVYAVPVARAIAVSVHVHPRETCSMSKFLGLADCAAGPLEREGEYCSEQ
jgi:hypothetical protein